MAGGYRVSDASGGALSRLNLACPQIGIIKDNVDSEDMGRLKVWIKGSNTLETDPRGWVTCSYASPFAGATDPETLSTALESFEGTQKSYGFWAVPPDLNNEVIVIFINGDMRKAFWTGCIYQKDMNYMVPGIADGASYQSGDFSGNALPVAEYNKLSNTADKRPYYQPLADGLKKQGLLDDDLRGAGNSSSRRGSPSSVCGLLTPGGNQFIMDDGNGSELIRLRTKSGAQVLISETTGHIYINSRDGNSWFELNNDGHIDCYAGAGFSVHTAGDINLNAGGNVNIAAGNDINIKSKNNTNINADANLTQVSLKDTTMSVHGKYTTAKFGDEQTFRGEGGYNVKYDTLTHPVISSTVDNSPPGFPLPTQHQQSLYNNATGGESPATTICDRVPDHEPWSPHAESIPSRIEVEQDASKASRGSVTEKADKPLPVVGSPTKGMKPGLYNPVGYDKNNNPTYTFSGTTTELKPVNDLVTSPEGIQFITRQEGGLQHKKYPDGNGYSIGVGHLIVPSDSAEVKSGVISTETGLALLEADLKRFEAGVKKYVTVPLTQAQFDALVSFAYNTGVGGPAAKGKNAKGLYRLIELSKLNEGNYADVPNTMAGFNKGRLGAGTPLKVLPVLVKRRREEGLMFARTVKTS